MSSVPRSSLVRQFRTLFEVGGVSGLTDKQLLERFVDRRDEAGEMAFEALVARHGPMVLGVCRRALADPNDVADAFQATFLVLVKKARSIRVDDSLGRWLYGVSRKVAARARLAASRRPNGFNGDVEARAIDPDRSELASVLDEELASLPERFRSALVLCDLGGLTHEEAARDLVCPVGTIKSRLSRGRQKLRERLERRGVAPSILTLLGARPFVPSLLAQAALKVSVLSVVAGRSAVGVVPASVMALSEGVLKTMTGIKLKLTLGALLMAGFAAVGGGVAGQIPKDEGKAEAGPAPGDDAPRNQQTLSPGAERLAKEWFPREQWMFEGNSPKYSAERLAKEWFPRDHWVNGKDVKFRYYDAGRGVALFAKESNKSDDGKQLRIHPFAMIKFSDDGKTNGIFTSDHAFLEFTLPLNQFKAGVFPQLRRAWLEGNVSSRNDKTEFHAEHAQFHFPASTTNQTPAPAHPLPVASPRLDDRSGLGSAGNLPREFKKISMPEYVVEAPDIIRVGVVEALVDRPILGERQVRPDGRISLGFYGEVYVAGLTTTEIKEKVALHLRKYLDDEKLGLSKKNPETGQVEPVAPALSSRIFVDVVAYNSKVYYVQGDVGVPGRLPITGNETVLDAINYAGGLIPTRSQKPNIRLVRPIAPGSKEEQILPVDLDAIVNRGETKTNYQLMPGDRLVVYRDPEIEMKPTQADLEARLLAVERKLEELTKAFEKLPKP